MVHKYQSHDTSVDESTLPVTPSDTTCDGGDNKSHNEHEQNVVLVLPLDDRVPRQVTNIGDTKLATGLDEHPTNM